jgi:predicted peptidase
MKAVLLFVAAALIALTADTGVSQEKKSPFESHEIAGHGGKLPYRLLRPEAIEKGKKYPLVLFLHGFGERGTDNDKQLKGVGSAFTKASVRKDHPAFVIAPQTPGSWIQHPVFDKPIPLSPKATTSLLLASDLINQMLKKDPIDPDRLYLMGYSNGACGVWELIERYPTRWAAAVPMAGAGDPGHLAAAKNLAIWAFHGAKDSTIPLQRMEELMTSFRAAGGQPLYTIVPNGQHYDAKGKGLGDPTVIPWMFAQHRGQPIVSFDKVAGPKAKRPTSLEK